MESCILGGAAGLFIGFLVCAFGAVLSDVGQTLSTAEFSWLARGCCSVSALAASGLTFCADRLWLLSTARRRQGANRTGILE